MTKCLYRRDRVSPAGAELLKPFLLVLGFLKLHLSVLNMGLDFHQAASQKCELYLM